MNKLFLLLAFLTLFTADKYPADITGQWVVDKVDLGNAPIPAEKKEMALMMAQEMFRNVALTFKADHTCTIIPNRFNIPDGCKWEYAAETGIIKITGMQNGKTRTLQFNAIEKEGKIYFITPKATTNLQVHRK